MTFPPSWVLFYAGSFALCHFSDQTCPGSATSEALNFTQLLGWSPRLLGNGTNGAGQFNITHASPGSKDSESLILEVCSQKFISWEYRSIMIYHDLSTIYIYKDLEGRCFMMFLLYSVFLQQIQGLQRGRPVELWINSLTWACSWFITSTSATPNWSFRLGWWCAGGCTWDARIFYSATQKAQNS